MSNSTSSLSVNDWLFRLFVAGSALFVGSILIFIVALLFMESLPLLVSSSFFKLFQSVQWYPSEGSFGMLPMFLGSLAVASGALVISLPFSIFCAVFMNFFAAPFVFIFMRRLLEVLAGIPSVIFGLWGLVELVPLLRNVSGHGTNMLAAILVLSMMIVPTMTLIIDKYFKAYPKEIYHNALALGIPVDRVVLRLILPTSRNSIFVGTILGFGRAVGETMAVLMVAGNVVQVPASLFDSVRTLTANIALEMSYAMGEHRAALFVCGLVLCVLVMGLFSFLKNPDRLEAL